MIYICNEMEFISINDAINYADYYFKLTGIILGIESEWYLLASQWGAKGLSFDNHFINY